VTTSDFELESDTRGRNRAARQQPHFFRIGLEDSAPFSRSRFGGVADVQPESTKSHEQASAFRHVRR
jgi:hypothetical protein